MRRCFLYIILRGSLLIIYLLILSLKEDEEKFIIGILLRISIGYGLLNPRRMENVTMKCFPIKLLNFTIIQSWR